MARRDYRDEQGNKLPGVTTIIGATWAKPALMHWAWKEGKEGRDYRDPTARDSGTCAHAMIEADLLGQKFDDSQWSSKILKLAGLAYAQFISWRHSHPFTVVAVEEAIISQEFRCGATLDCVGVDSQGTLTLLDWKTSEGCYSDYIIQCAAYREIWNATNTRLIESVHIVRFPKDGSRWEDHRVPRWDEWEVETKDPRYPRKMPSLERGLRIFRGLRELYDERLAIGEV